MLNRYYLIAGVFFVMIAGCTSTTPSTKITQPLVVDPVCAYLSDMGCINIAVSDNTPKSTYEGVTYYFCSKECKVDFDRNPLKYLKAVTSPKGSVDPVCQMRINEPGRFVLCVYQNNTYCFCSDHCREKFMSNPDHYTKEK